MVDDNVYIPEILLERIKSLWSITKRSKLNEYVNTLLEIQLAAIEDIYQRSDQMSSFRVVVDPTLPDTQLLVIDKTPEKRKYITNIVQEMDPIDPNLHLLLQDTEDPEIKFTVVMNDITAEYTVLGGWQTE